MPLEPEIHNRLFVKKVFGMQDLAPVRILLVEDDRAIAVTLNDMLCDVGYDCEICSDGLEGLTRAKSGKFDLLVLDINLPNISGLDVCREVKKIYPDLPIIMLTARTEEADVVTGLELGADDYIVKPFKSRELLARIRARLRERTQKLMSSALAHDPSEQPSARIEESLIRIGEIALDLRKKRATKKGEVIETTAKEFNLLALLARQPGRPFEREELLRLIWGLENPAYDSNISVFVSRLRKKIEEDPLNPKYLLTVRGVGYRFVEAHELPDELKHK